MGVGKKIAILSLKHIFNLGADEIYIEARDITLRMLRKFGCEVVGDARDFYGESVTPITIKQCHFKDIQE